MIRIAMIGAGAMATRVHYPSLAAFDDVQIVAVCDLDAQRLAAAAEIYGIPGIYTDYRRMIEEVAPDAVYAIGPPHIMYDIWCWCLEAGQNLCIEKPMGITLHQARSLAYLADMHGCITQVSFQRRTSPMVTQLHDLCSARGLISHAVCRFYKWEPAPYLGARDHMMDDGVHAIDTLRWICGGEVIDVQSKTRRIGTPDINFIVAMLHFDNGATGILMNNWTSGRRIFSVEMHAPGIYVEAEHEGTAMVYTDGDIKGTAYDARAVAGSNDLYVYGGFLAKNRQFIDAVSRGHQPPSSFADALKTMEIADRILAMDSLTGDSLDDA